MRKILEVIELTIILTCGTIAAVLCLMLLTEFILGIL